MNKLSIEQAENLIECLEGAIYNVHATEQNYSVVHIEKLDRYVSMPSSDAPQEFGWEIVAEIGE